MSEGLVHELARFAEETAERGLSDDLSEEVKFRVLDMLGNALAARGDSAADAVLSAISANGGQPEATLLGEKGRLPAANAALFNGTLAHVLDFDDTHLPSVLHPSASVVPTALAMGELSNAPGRDVLAAVAVGVEICVRLGMASYDPAIKNSIFFENGLHATSICGALASAATAALLLELGSDRIAHAMGIAASMGAGLLEANRAGGSVKRIHCGWAAHSGINAALLAQHGLTGPPTVLEGRFGFYRAYSEGRFDPEAITEGLGERWELSGVFYKPYPSNHFTHAGIDAALAIRDRGVDPSTITGIELGVAAPVLRTIAEPRERKARPSTSHEAKFSGPFTLATALIGGGGLGVYMEDFTEDTIRDSARLELADLVRCYADEEATDAFPHQFPAVVTVTLNDGSVVRERVRYNRGGPMNPLTSDELMTKFRLNAGQSLASEEVAALEFAVERLPEVADLGELMKATRSI